ncbi:hypothetical protein [Paraoerskovia marina]|uniref:hypothetical protein n=1 Tax=Paraoerskovia marina TaxID=545619 RepID=UPI00049276FE|nr:hypothetical protein [Paraoerskovia marina]
MLGRSEQESGTHASLAVDAGGWVRADDALDAGTVEMLDLGSTGSTLSTTAGISGLRAVVHLGHPLQPAPGVEQALLAADSSLIVTAAVAITPTWCWVGRDGQASGPVVVDEPGLRDCRDALRTMGAAPRLVPGRTSTDERVDLAGPTGTLVVERDRIPAGWAELPGSEALSGGNDVWYGLVEALPAAPTVPAGTPVWLAFGPRDDHRGSLQQSLEILADHGVDLDHLRSMPSTSGQHVFFSAFTSPESGAFEALRSELAARGVRQRLLAVLSGVADAGAPGAIGPQWGRADA